MDQYITFFDVDGTLSLPQLDMTDKTKEALIKLKENGHYVFLCTGRNYAGVSKLMNTGLFDGTVCSAGGFIKCHDEIIYSSHMSDELLKFATDVFTRNNMMYNYEADYITFMTEEMQELFLSHISNGEENSEMARLREEHKNNFQIHNMEEYDGTPVQKLSFIAYKQEQLIEPKELLSKDFAVVIHDIFGGDTINGEIIPKTINKGIGVKKVCEYLHIPLEHTVGFGDSMNDYEMIRTCKYGVCMGNGSNELKKHADIVCESVKDEGIYHELQRLGLI